jgi:hypothetical protein
MYKIITEQEFIGAFGGRHFTRDALTAIYDHLTDVEEDTGEPIRLDVVGLCGEFAERTREEIAEAHCIPLDGVDVFLEDRGALVADLGDSIVYYLE